jgi:uncharacterized lipoprotein
MKKLIAAMLAVCLVMGITACGNTQNSKSSSLKDGAQEESTQIEKRETDSSTQMPELNTEISNQTTGFAHAYVPKRENQ